VGLVLVAFRLTPKLFAESALRLGGGGNCCYILCKPLTCYVR
jgi:hypothetical protein